MFRRIVILLLVMGMLVTVTVACSIGSSDRDRSDLLLVTGGVPYPGDADRIVLLTKGGYVIGLSLDGDPEPALMADLTKKVSLTLGPEEGLLSMAFSPRFEADGLVYLNYTAGTNFVTDFANPPVDPRRNVISRFRVVAGKIEMDSEEVLLEVLQPHQNHNAGQLVFGPDGYLYIGVGDGGGEGDPNDYGQEIVTFLASILRIDVSPPGPYTMPPDNPFADGFGGNADEVYAFGFRNPWRFSFDRLTGDLWAGDVGQSAWEEVNFVRKGGNYGWSCFEGFEPYADSCDAPGALPPVLAYGRSDGCAIIGGHVYRGAAEPDLYGQYIYGDYCTGTVWSVSTIGESEPRVIFTVETRLSSFVELADGELLVVTANEEIYRVSGDFEPAFDDLDDLISRAVEQGD